MRQTPTATIGLWCVLTGAMLTGCAPHPEPGAYDAGVMGTNAQVGAIQLRSVHIESPSDSAYSPGADARIWLTLRNSSHEADALTSVTSAVADHAEIQWDDDCDGEFDTVQRLPLQPAAPAPDSNPSTIPVFDAYHVRLVDLTREVQAGTTVPVTFRFEQAGAITLNVKVQPDVPRAEPSNRCVPYGR